MIYLFIYSYGFKFLSLCIVIGKQNKVITPSSKLLAFIKMIYTKTKTDIDAVDLSIQEITEVKAALDCANGHNIE